MSPLMAWPQRGGIAWSQAGNSGWASVATTIHRARHAIRIGDPETAAVLRRAIVRGWAR